MTLPQLDDFAEQVVSPALSQLAGVGEVQVFGAQKFAVRAEVNPYALAGLGIGIDQVTSAVSAANSIAPVGTLAGANQNLAIQADTPMTTASQFRQIIIANPNGKPVRLGDVANVVNSVANTQTLSTYDGTPSLILAVFREPDANTVDVVNQVKAALPKFHSDLGTSGSLNVLNDRSISIVQAVADVEMTLAITIALVALVILLFLRRLTITVIPILAVPISLIATLGGDVSARLLDRQHLAARPDAGGRPGGRRRHRHAGEHRAPHRGGHAAVRGRARRQSRGRLHHHLDHRLAGGGVPAHPADGRRRRPHLQRIRHGGDDLDHRLVAGVADAHARCWRRGFRRARRHARSAGHEAARDRACSPAIAGCSTWPCASARSCLLVFFGTVVATAYLFATAPKGFLPTQDIGQLSVSTQAREDISFKDMLALQNKVIKVLQAKPYVAHVASIVGGGFGASTSNTGHMFVQLKPKNGRRSARSSATCAARSAGSPASRPSSRRSRTCISAATRRRPSTSTSCRASTAPSCSPGPARSRTR